MIRMRLFSLEEVKPWFSARIILSGKWLVSFVFCKNLYFEGKIDKYIRKGKRNAISAKELSFFTVVMLVIQKERKS